MHTAARRNQVVGAPINATVDVVETYSYLARQGRPSTRTTELWYGGVLGETWSVSQGINILGGLGSLYGAVIGAAAYLFLEEWLSSFTEHWKVIFGPLLVLVVLFAPGGLKGVWSRLFGRRRPG